MSPAVCRVILENSSHAGKPGKLIYDDGSNQHRDNRKANDYVERVQITFLLLCTHFFTFILSSSAFYLKKSVPAVHYGYLSFLSHS